MYAIKYYLEKYKIHIIVFTIILITLLTYLLYFNFSKRNKREEVIEIENKESVELLSVDTSIEDEEIEDIENTDIKKVKVDVKGMVKMPGVYEIDENSRVIDAINISGGLIDGANTSYINLSKKVTDEMIIIVYSNEEIESFKEDKKEIIYVEKECECPDNINDACISENKESDKTVNTKENTDNLVSINSGTKEELMTLDGIGESKAQAIIDYRLKNGNFLNLEDLMNVSGIGEKAYSKIKDNIKL